MSAPARYELRPPTCHVLKCWPEFFQPISSGHKTCELRRDDRGGFRSGDMLLLQEWDPEMGAYTGAVLFCAVSHVLTGTETLKWIGLQEGYALLSIQLMTVVPT
ncbi:MAG: DUF3850 domain-containing protein [Chloroflexi bacterium]|nr:DUF3850 domain-containing protein [Chloroflexota bacterium]